MKPRGYLAGQQAGNDADASEGVTGYTCQGLHLAIVLSDQVPPISYLPGQRASHTCFMITLIPGLRLAC